MRGVVRACVRVCVCVSCVCVVCTYVSPPIHPPTHLRHNDDEQAVCAVALGLLISAFAPDVPSATALAPPVTIVFMLVGCVCVRECLGMRMG